jgi:hypothetical protein
MERLREMNSLEQSLLRKAGYDNGWENVLESTPQRVALVSSRHRAEAYITPGADTAVPWLVAFPAGPTSDELARSFPLSHIAGYSFRVSGEASLAKLLRRAAELAMSLPNQAADNYAAEVAKIDPVSLSTTEVLRLVKQRIGQDIFRAALMDYWAGACAVTGIAIPGLLRASHAKPWAECSTDADRLNVFNGLLLCAHLDALFDRGLMTFTDEGEAVFSESVDGTAMDRLNLKTNLHLRWLARDHLPFIQWHRQHIFNSGAVPHIPFDPSLRSSGR